MTRPRRRAGQVSATSEVDDAAYRHEGCPCGGERQYRHHDGEQGDVERQQGAASVTVGQPGPDEHAQDADQQGNLQARPVIRDSQAEFLDEQRRGQGDDHAVHAVEAPAEAVGDGDMDMRRGDPGLVGCGSEGGRFAITFLKRPDFRGLAASVDDGTHGAGAPFLPGHQ
jgi:hypothetical protein